MGRGAACCLMSSRDRDRETNTLADTRTALTFSRFHEDDAQRRDELQAPAPGEVDAYRQLLLPFSIVPQ